MYRRLNSGWLKHLDFEVFDIICIELAFYLAYFFRHKSAFPHVTPLYVQLGVFLVLFHVCVIFFSNSYSNIVQRTKWPELWETIKHVSTVEIMLLIYTYLSKSAELYSRTVFLVGWAMAIVLCYGVRIVWKKVVRHQLTKEANQANLLLISTANRLAECVKSIREKPYRGFKISCVALLHESVEDELYETNIPIIWGKDIMLEYIRHNVVDEVFIDYYENRDELSALVDIFLEIGVTVHIGASYLPEDLPNRFVEEIGGETVFTTSLRTATAWKLSLKRMVDIVAGMLGIVITGILCLFIVPAIIIADPGPIFFKQKRVGKNGRIFNIYKFRSMYVDAEQRKKELLNQNEMSGLMFKMENDPRIIGSEKGNGKGFGNFIRKTSLDEFPQFWNILRGDMSLIGTRPPTVQEFEQYDLHHKVRLSMKPGLTGMWQVSGRNTISDFEDVVKLDLKYIENWSLLLDAKILIKTLKVVIMREGSK